MEIEENECCICLHEIEQKYKYIPKIKLCSCNASYHIECYQGWISKTKFLCSFCRMINPAKIQKRSTRSGRVVTHLYSHKLLNYLFEPINRRVMRIMSIETWWALIIFMILSCLITFFLLLPFLIVIMIEDFCLDAVYLLKNNYAHRIVHHVNAEYTNQHATNIE
ncbi:MAG: hypothetical protein Terrestrivirus5_73 [Terrestrivirus sp.]|uniref:RING-type domain-containing protein n=1 Tax=Terrestrivirus sp. TaxID=2487775 RepID=A0A3G4ZQH8_9VIRU|nr:MAG: hypothetical protein Terrestrivirus5_73 [Terrestrivirus sp.]